MSDQNIHNEKILILDFGSQVTQLIARRVREIGVYCELWPWDSSEEQIKAFRLVDNKTQELAEWDWNIIFEELDLIKDIDMNKMGFEEFLDDDKGELKERKIGMGEEIDLDSFADEEFNTVCPCCGFRFND
jgi:hypothetical protein